MLLPGAERKVESRMDQGENTLVPAAITDTGCERELNEDRYAVVECSSGVAWLVCDGMGGATGGELAAQIAIDAIRRDLEGRGARRAETALRSSILEANRIIVLRRQNQAFAGMGTTIVATLFQGPEVVVAHVGDSRAYLVRDGAIQQLTVDHTFVQQLVEKGQISADEALSHPQAHILTRCIGSEPALEVEVRRFWVWPTEQGEPQDHLLLCTDGLYSLVTEGELATLVSENSPQTACVKMVELAKNRGGFDNITCAIIPMGGQLRQEPPPGYDENTVLRALAAPEPSKAEGRSVLRLFAIVFMLSSLAAMLTALAMVFFISR
jgi:serine/threonine protein phosphatase PrpC